MSQLLKSSPLAFEKSFGYEQSPGRHRGLRGLSEGVRWTFTEGPHPSGPAACFSKADTRGTILILGGGVRLTRTRLNEPNFYAQQTQRDLGRGTFSKVCSGRFETLGFHTKPGKPSTFQQRLHFCSAALPLCPHVKPFCTVPGVSRLRDRSV